ERRRRCVARRRRRARCCSARAPRRVGRRNARRDAALARRPRAARARGTRRGARGAAAGDRGMKLTGFLFLATVFCVTWEKVQWGFGVDVSISDVLTILFLLSLRLEWAVRGERRFPKSTAVVLVIFAVLLVIYLVGFFNIQTKDSLDQWLKGMVKFVLHFLFLAAGVAYLARRSRGFYWQVVGALAL